MKKLICLLGAVSMVTAMACTGSRSLKADYGVVPLPQTTILNDSGEYVFKPGSASIGYPAGDAVMEENARILAGYLNELTGKTPSVKEGEGAITLVIDPSVENPEGYRMEVSADGVRISGSTPAGVFYGMQTLRKSLPAFSDGNVSMPYATIVDYPRFPYRGMHLDVSRHFMEADSVKAYIDILALHNMNTFHWHLTDDQGWRIEIKKYPELTEKGSIRTQTLIGHGEQGVKTYDGTPYGPYFYTQDEIKEVIDYAAKRHITIIPEIDLPGHQRAALHTYPHLGCTGGPYDVWTEWGVTEEVLCAGNEQAMQFLEDVLEEVIELFPSEYIHIGGDESPKIRWEQCPKCQAKIHELGIKGDKHHTPEEYLQSYVITRMEQFVESKGRHIIGWDEILEGGLAPNATVMSWQGVSGGIEAARQGHKVIMTPSGFLYFDYYQSEYQDDEPLGIGGYVPVERVYAFEPTTGIPEENQHYVIGVQANLWREYIKTFWHTQYMILPRAAALSEVQWTQPEKKDYMNFLSRMPRLTKLYDRLGYNYAKHIFDISADFTTDRDNNKVVVTLEKLSDGEIRYTLDGSDPTAASALYEGPIEITENAQLRALIFDGGKPAGRVFNEGIYFNKATSRPIMLKSSPSGGYTFNGAPTLNDGLRGNRNYKSGRWLGFNRNHLDAVIDLGEGTTIGKVFIQTNVAKRDWIMGARGIEVLVSEDGENFRPVASLDIPSQGENDPNGLYDHEVTFEPVTTRYVEVIVKRDILPAWHNGAGRPGYLFVDEIGVE